MMASSISSLEKPGRPACSTIRGSPHCQPLLKARRLMRLYNPNLRGSLLRAVAARLGDECESRLDLLQNETMDADAVLAVVNALPLDVLMARAAALRDEGHMHVTFSPKVFIPLTKLCRDTCGYCTFAQPPVPGRRAYMTVDEVLAVARLGAERGCTEALFTLGDKPELAYPEAAAELADMGYASTVEYVAAAAGEVLRQTGLLPHINAGVMGRDELRALRQVSVSQGLMLESTSKALLQPGGPHADCPDKHPDVRLATIEAAGQEQVPFTTGLLVGIGESRRDRVEALLAIWELHRRYDHIQELIIQNFRAKHATAMAGKPEPQLEELLWTVAVARLLFGPAMNIQAPPNLTPEPDDSQGSSRSEGWELLLAAGINDWGGLSPVTRDYVSPEKPWPHICQLAAATAAMGKALLPRLPLYPAYCAGLRWVRWLDASGGPSSPAAAALRLMDSEGFVRASTWYAGAPGANEEPQSAQLAESDRELKQPTQAQPEGGWQQTQTQAAARSGGEASTSGQGHGGAAEKQQQRQQQQQQQLKRSIPPARRRASRDWAVSLGRDGLLEGCPRPTEPSPRLQALLQAVLDDSHELSQEEIVFLFAARGADFHALCTAADRLRQRINGDTVSFVVNCNINYTNVCTFACAFCAFSKGKVAEALRGKPYLLSLEEVRQRAAEAWGRGATELCMQGGIHPDFTGDTYLQLLGAAKAAAPGIHVHAFSPLEVSHGAASLGRPLKEYLAELKAAGLGSLPGTAAEVLDDSVRAELCPDKLSTGEWLTVVETAHSVGLPTTSTIMFGHCDDPTAWASHLAALRAVASRTGGITEFVPLPFVHMEAPIYLKGRSRRGPTLRECVLMHAVARLALHPHITNIQASWVKMGPAQAAQLLMAGCNDMGGSLMHESISRAAGASHGQELPPASMVQLIRNAARTPCMRTTLYEDASKSSQAA